MTISVVVTFVMSTSAARASPARAVRGGAFWFPFSPDTVMFTSLHYPGEVSCAIRTEEQDLSPGRDFGPCDPRVIELDVRADERFADLREENTVRDDDQVHALFVRPARRRSAQHWR